MKQKVNLLSLRLALNKHFQRPAVVSGTADTVVINNNSIIRIYIEVTIRYQSWRGVQSAPPAMGLESQSFLTSAKENEIKSLLNQKLMIKEQIRAGVESRLRQNCVLIRTSNRIPHKRVNFMSRRQVAQVIVFFQCEVLGIWHKLRYVS